MYLTDAEKSNVVSLLRTAIDPVLIYLYGSFARGEGREDSDIDLAVWCRQEQSAYTLFMISGELASALKREVQLQDFRTVSTVLGAQIVGNHQVLYAEDETFRANLNIRFFKEYALLNEERACVLDRVREEGYVYGERRLPK